MKRLFLDTNVLLEEVLNRRHALEAERLMDSIAAGKAEGYISVGAVYTLCFYVEKGLREFIADKEERLAKSREVISQLLAALAAGCDALVTINTKAFPSPTAIPVVHLAEFEI